MRRPPVRQQGFTLVEILVALAIVGLLLVAMNTFIFSMGELWGRHSQQRLFDQHVNAVMRFLQDEINVATFPPSARANSQPVAPLHLAPENGMPDNFITFDLPAGCRILSWPGRPLPEVTCSLAVRPNDGLYLLWHSRLETTYATQPPREVKISPYVTAISYDYYDDNVKQWSTVQQMKPDTGGGALAPQRIRLTWQYGKLPPRDALLVIPNALQGLPNF